MLSCGLVGACGARTLLEEPEREDLTGLAADPDVRLAAELGSADFEPAPAGLRRLTASELSRSLRDLLGVDVAKEVEPDVAVAGYSTVGAGTAGYSERGVETLVDAVLNAAATVLTDRAKRDDLLGCSPSSLSDPCVSKFIEEFGRRAWRRQLGEEELSRYAALAANAETALGDPWQGLAIAVGGLLASPNFAYRVELGQPVDSGAHHRAYTGYEMATRLSYTIWGTTPDEQLLDAAGQGKLGTLDGVLVEADRLIRATRARRGAQQFFREYWHASGLTELDKNEEVFPRFDHALGDAMREEINVVIMDAAFGAGADLLQVFVQPRGFVNAELADLYGVRHPGGPGFVSVDFPPSSHRAGVLTLAGFLASNARATRTSPTLRGRFIRTRILCQEVEEPPRNVDAAIDLSDSDGITLRERLQAHSANPACGACHELMDPLGLAFERFDGIGAYRETEEGRPIDESGEFDGVPFSGARELGMLLADSRQVADCMATQLYRYSIGHVETAGEEPVLDALGEAFRRSNHSFPVLLAAVTASDGFRYASEPE